METTIGERKIIIHLGGKILNSERSEFFNAMFTGIITNLGEISKKETNKLSVKANKALIGKLSDGLSIAVDGICLTVISKSEKEFSVNFIPETEAKTNIKYLKVGSLVNLELPATYQSFLSGHVVEGHIDRVGQLVSIKKQNDSYILKFSIPESLSLYIVSKGPIAINGVSLTVIEVKKDFFTVGIIPYTWKNTMLHTTKVGDFVNIEIDILAKYLAKLTKNETD